MEEFWGMCSEARPVKKLGKTQLGRGRKWSPVGLNQSLGTELVHNLWGQMQNKHTHLFVQNRKWCRRWY